MIRSLVVKALILTAGLGGGYGYATGAVPLPAAPAAVAAPVAPHATALPTVAAAAPVAPHATALPTVAAVAPVATCTPQEAAQPPAAAAPSTSGLLNLNTATVDELDALPAVAITPEVAQRIVAARPFTSVAQLDDVKGVGPATMRRVTPLVTV